MSTLDTKKIMVPLADQLTTGAALAGNVITSIPATFADALAAISGFTPTGYLGEDGIALSTSLSTTDFKEMNRGTVRKGLDDFTGTVTYTELQLVDEDVLKRKFGADNVAVTNATADHGKQMHVKIGTSLPPEQAFAWKLKDGDMRAIVLVPKGQVTNGLDVTFAANAMATISTEVTAYDDGTGKSIHIYFDDGTVISASAVSTLSALTISSLSGSMSPTFDDDVTEYTATASGTSSTVTATATASGAGVVVVVNGSSIASGGTAAWKDGKNDVYVTVANGGSSTTYHVEVTASVA